MSNIKIVRAVMDLLLTGGFITACVLGRISLFECLALMILQGICSNAVEIKERLYDRQ